MDFPAGPSFFRVSAAGSGAFTESHGSKNRAFFCGSDRGSVDLGADCSGLSRGRNGARFGSGREIDPA